MAWLIIVIATICLFGMTAWADKSLPAAERLPMGWHGGEPTKMSGRLVSLYFFPVLAFGALVALPVLFGYSRWPLLAMLAVFYVLVQFFMILRLRNWFRRGMPLGWYAAPGGLNRPHG